jgi:hypothetical protein
MVGRVKCPQFRVILSEVDALPGEAATQSKDPCLLDMQWDGLCSVSRPDEGRSVSPDAGTVGPSTPPPLRERRGGLAQYDSPLKLCRLR